ELPDVRDRRFLQPCSDIAREEVADGIRARGGEIQQLVVYRTLPPDDENARRLAEHTDLQTYDCVAFFSPSAVRHYAELLPETQRHTAIVAVIGDTTGAEAATHDLRVRIIPREQHAAALADAIVAWHQGRYSDDTAA
ncbi:MAG: uroporphyrinogen-III synthase, partial [Bacteroidetes bacterium]|nr:uroporphyrinogen-III synthase [Bacteroidota bacterium]